MLRKRVLHSRKRETEKGVASTIVLPPRQREELLKQIDELEKELEKLKGTDKETKRKRLAIARQIRDLKLRLGLSAAKGGRKNILIKIFRGKEEDLQEYLIKRISWHTKQYEREYGGEIPYSLLLRKLRQDLLKKAKENNVRLTGKGTILSERTIRNYIDQYKLREQKKSKISLFEQDAWKNFIKEKAAKDESYASGIQTAVKSFYAFLKASPKYGEDIANNPEEWTKKMVEDWLESLRGKGLAQNTCRSYLVGLRRFWEEGLNRPDISDLRLKAFGETVELQTPDRIEYFNQETLDRMVSLVPHKTMEIQFKRPDGKVAKRKLEIKSKADRKMYQAIIRLMACTGARTGKIASPEWVGKNIEGILNTWEVPETVREMNKDQIFRKNHGTVSIRLQDLQYVEIDKNELLRMAKELNNVQPLEAERLRTIANSMEQSKIGYWTILGISEKMKKVWWHVMLSEKASERLEEYLRERFNLSEDYTGQKLEEFLIDYSKEVRRNIELNKARWLEMHNKAQTKDPKTRKKIYKKIGKEFLEEYQKILLFPISENDIHSLIYILAYRALEQGKPLYLSVTKGRPVKLDLDTVYKSAHKGHLFRKSFVQNLLNKGVPMEVVSEFNVGWFDLTTLKKFYGHMPEGRRIFTYLTAVRGEI